MLRLAAEVGVGDNGERHVEQKFKELFQLIPPRHHGKFVGRKYADGKYASLGGKYADVLSVDGIACLGVCQTQRRYSRAIIRRGLSRSNAGSKLHAEVRSPATCHHHARWHAPQRAQQHGCNQAYGAAIMKTLVGRYAPLGSFHHESVLSVDDIARLGICHVQGRWSCDHTARG